MWQGPLTNLVFLLKQKNFGPTLKRNVVPNAIDDGSFYGSNQLNSLFTWVDEIPKFFSVANGFFNCNPATFSLGKRKKKSESSAVQRHRK
jgi:hypothetical protein